MKKLFSKLLPCLLVVLLLLGITACQTQEAKYAHPGKEAMVSNPNDVFLQLGNKTITNKVVYNRLIQTYGLDGIIQWMDEITLKDFQYDEKDFEDHLNFIIYGTENLDTLTAEEIAEAKAAHEKTMLNQGYETEDEWRKYYVLEYKRYAYGLQEFEKHIDKLNENEDTKVFDEEMYEKAYNTIFQNDYSAIILTFDSEWEARQVLKSHNIDLTDLTFGWSKVENEIKTALSASEVKELFETIHSEMNGYDWVPAVQEFKYNKDEYKNELADFSATIANKLAQLEVNEYTVAPLTYGSRYYLAFKVSETETYVEYEELDKENEAHAELIAEVKKYLLETSITSADLLVAAQQAGTLKVLEEGLEIGYNKYYNDNINEAGLEIDKYVPTTEESDTVVAKLHFNGKDYELTADQLYQRLLDRYSVALSLLYIQEYIVLSNPEYNKVTEYETGKVVDQKLYDQYYKTDIQAYKDSLAKGDYASKGFPANYGWDKFMLDYFGVATEAELMALYGGSLYSAAEGYYVKDIYMEEAHTEKDEEGKDIIVPADHLVQAEMEKIFEEYFNASMVGVYAYFDKEANGLTNNQADEMTEEQQKTAKELVELAYTKAKEYKAEEVNGTLAAALDKVVKEYKSSTMFDENDWAKYKAQGLQLILVTSTTYTNTSTADQAILDEAQKQWNLVDAYEDAHKADTKVAPLGQTLDPGYRNENAGLVTYLTSEYFADQSEAFISNNAAYRLAITKAFDHTYIKKSEESYRPTLEQYETYLKDAEDVSSAVATAIKTYYVTAIKNLTTTEIISDKLFTETLNLVNAGEKVKVPNETLKANIIKVINESLKAEEAE